MRKGLEATGRQGPSLSAVLAGLLAGFVGFASSFAVVLAGFRAAGADEAQAASALAALSVAMGLGGVLLSQLTRMPISVAWSTPGSALLAASGTVEGGFGVAVGAFLAASAMIVLAGLVPRIGRALQSLPPALAGGMLAGVLLPLCVAPVRALAVDPLHAFPVVLAWAVVARMRRVLAVPAAVLVAAAMIGFTQDLPALPPEAWLPRLVWTPPEFRLAALIGTGLPLFVVTMASQNVPGLAVLAANGFRPPPGRLFAWTGLLGMLAAPFGGHAVNLAAITAAICAGPDSDPDPNRRHWAALFAGLVYVGFGLLVGAVTVLVAAAPPVLIEAVAGLALLPALGTALKVATEFEAEREPALIAFVAAASGVAVLGIGGAFWGLMAGLLLRWARAGAR